MLQVPKPKKQHWWASWWLRKPLPRESMKWFSTAMVFCIMEELNNWLTLPVKVALNFNDYGGKYQKYQNQ